MSLSLQNQRLVTCTPQANPIGFTIGKSTKALSDPSLFIDGKNLSIDQSKMQGTLKIKWDHYPSKRNKLIYPKNRVGGKVLQHSKPCLQLNSISLCTIIEDLFNNLENIFGNPH